MRRKCMHGKGTRTHKAIQQDGNSFLLRHVWNEIALSTTLVTANIDFIFLLHTLESFGYKEGTDWKAVGDIILFKTLDGVEKAVFPGVVVRGNSFIGVPDPLTLSGSISNKPISKMKVKELKAQLGMVGLKKKGLKPELVKRLQDYYSSISPAVPAAVKK